MITGVGSEYGQFDDAKIMLTYAYKFHLAQRFAQRLRFLPQT